MTERITIGKKQGELCFSDGSIIKIGDLFYHPTDDEKTIYKVFGLNQDYLGSYKLKSLRVAEVRKKVVYEERFYHTFTPESNTQRCDIEGNDLK